jgi:hypothetical protein
MDFTLFKVFSQGLTADPLRGLGGAHFLLRNLTLDGFYFIQSVFS